MANVTSNGMKYQALVDWLAARTALYVALLTDGYTPDADHDFFDDVAADEISATGYTQYGAALGSPAITKDNDANRAYLDADDSVWDPFTGTARYAVVYDKTAGATSTWGIVGIVDFGANKSASGAEFKITWAAPGNGGVLYLS